MVRLRSETMKHGTLVLPSDRAREFVDLLGREAKIQFEDMNELSMKRQYKKYIQRTDEIERLLRFLDDEMQKLPGITIEKQKFSNFLDNDSDYTLEKVEENVKTISKQFLKFRENNITMMTEKNIAKEEHAIAKVAMNSLAPGGGANTGGPNSAVSFMGDEIQGIGEGDGSALGFSSITGVIKREDQDRFARTLFRATRGNAYTHFEAIDGDLYDADSGKSIPKTVLVTYFQGGSSSIMHDKILKICSAFGVNTYVWPKSFEEARQKSMHLQDIIEDKTRALEAYEEYFVAQIQDLIAIVRPGGNSLIEEWSLFCKKEKSIYATLNLLEGSDVTLRGDCWYPEEDEHKIRALLSRQSDSQYVSAFLLSDKSMSATKQPPTYFRTTEFTEAFQGFVNTYGIPRYKEANPTVITIVTLPFLFGVMYGDVGHGIGIVLFSSYMIYAYKTLKEVADDTVQMIVGGRWMILLMGCFSVYGGLMYNEFFAIGMNLFGSRYVAAEEDALGRTMSFPDENSAFPYPFGFDPVWKGATNEIDFYNSFKMKFAVIVALLHMTAGVCHKALNTFYFRDSLSFVFEIIPSFILLWGLVGWMDFLIIFKWATDMSWPKPSIIQTIIEMFSFSVSEPFFPAQGTIQSVIILLMVVAVPIMLIPKPFIIRKRHYDSLKETGAYHDPEEFPSSVVEENEEEEFDFSEVFIHQVIETTEFALGVVSNTASYLRLWALSLAHQQLSMVYISIIYCMIFLGMF
eukprot:GHVP01036703.1.p1 GENE.GHVP01036703.1~~GHVP01036703.1.p1  ORF type:complete len:744 (+),score=139.70 GHVP01036703.1:49-2280(+)